MTVSSWETCQPPPGFRTSGASGLKAAPWPAGSHCQQVGRSIWCPRGPPGPAICLRPPVGLHRPRVCRDLGQGGDLSCHPSLSVYLSIHLSTSLTDQGRGRDRQMQVLPLEKPSLQGQASSTRHLHPGKTQLSLGPDLWAGQGHGWSPQALEMEAQRRWGLAPRQTVGQGQCWARCCGPRAGGSSGWPLPHHPAWPLAVNTERTSSVSREIFISGRVGSVRWPPPVLPAG